MKKLLPLLVLFVISLYPLAQFAGLGKESTEAAEQERGSRLPTAASDVVILVTDFSGLPGDLLERRNLETMRTIDRVLLDMPGLRGYSSLFTASVGKA